MGKRLLNIRVAACMCLAAAVALGGGVLASLLMRGTVHPGVRAAGLNLKGLTLDEASSRLASRSAELSNTRIQLVAGGFRWSTTATTLGGKLDPRACAQAAYRIGRQGSVLQRLSEILTVRRHGRDVPFGFEFDKKALLAELRRFADQVDRAPVNAAISIEADSIVITPEQPGVRLDVTGNAKRVVDKVRSGAETIDLDIQTALPEIKAEDLQGIDGLLATYSTEYPAWQRARTHNLRIACTAVDGTVIKPGGVFSYNEIVGPRERKYGFQDAPMFVKGEIEAGTGGGVCQVSTTIYNAALLANLKIRSRAPHSRPVVYAPVGRDATVAYGLVDMKFENNTDVPIYIRAGLDRRRVVVSIYGRRQEGRDVDIVSANHSVIPARTITRVDPSMKPGQTKVVAGRSGHRITIYRVLKMNGAIASRERISTNYYPPEHRVVIVGPSP